MIKHIVISALGEDKLGIVNTLSKKILDAGGNVTDSRMTVLGEEFALLMLVTGSDSAIEKIKALLPEIEQSLALTVIFKETGSGAQGVASIPYFVEIVAMDNPGIVHEITEFLGNHHINVEELSTSSYPAAHTGTIMFAMELSISIPATLNISTLKTAFFAYCDDLNLDATLVPH